MWRGRAIRRGLSACVLAASALSGLLVAAGTSSSAGAASSKSSASDAAWGATLQACDALDASLCMLPFPNDFYTVANKSMPTGRQIYFPPGALPVAAGGAVFNPAPWEGNDGFSPGSTILTHVPGLNLAASGIATISNMGAATKASSPDVLLDATTGTRWPAWAELDAHDTNPSTQVLIIHPLQNLAEGHRYIVALRNLKTASGAAIAPEPAFASVLGQGPVAAGLSAAYQSHLRTVVSRLNQAGVPSHGLFLAWDFTVASSKNLTAPALTMRNQTFAALGHGVSPYLVTKVVDNPPGQPALARVVTGYFDVPSYLTGLPGLATSVLSLGANGLPVHQPGHIDVANFECEIPKAATAAHPAAIGIYGHGLFGSADEVTASSVPQLSNAYDYVFCGTDWTGLSESSIGLALGIIVNLSNFPALADNLMQALLNAQVLGNLLVNAKGFAKNKAFENASGRSLIRSGSNLVYYGNSEGGIMGGAFTALSTQARRAVLGVPGMDYAVLLPRSADFSPFQTVIDKSYPNPAVQQLGFDIIQMLWDRAEADGYAEQMTGGLPGTPAHQVLLEEAFGDHQVANIATETEARTIDAHVHQPALAAGRSLQKQPFYGLAPFTAGSSGPALFVWDTSVPPAPLADVPPTAGPDPHGSPRSFPAVWRQINTFFQTGSISNPCRSAPCTGPKP